MNSIKIYVASKAKHAPKWLALRNNGWPINSTWIEFGGDNMIDDWALHWQRCIDEAAAADYCLAYCEPEDHFKGAHTEMGAALAMGRKVIFVGEPNSKRYSVTKHPNVTVVETLEEALAAMILQQEERLDSVLEMTHTVDGNKILNEKTV